MAKNATKNIMKYYWPLQGECIDAFDRNILSKFIIKTKKFTQSNQVKIFEKKFSQWQSSKYSIFVNSGSSANLLIIFTCKDLYKWDEKSEVIVPSLTWTTTVTPVLQAGLKPVFVDCNLKDYSFDYQQLEKRITKNTKAIFVAHILGFPADIKKIKEIIKKRKIILLEDSCESIGARLEKKKVGNFGLASSFSFYWGHHLSTIEGGMITTNNKKFYERCIIKRSHGLARELPKKSQYKIKSKFSNINFKYLFITDGFNLRNTEINAFLGNLNIKKLNKWIKVRNQNYTEIFELLKKKFNKYFILPNFKRSYSSFAISFVFKQKKIKLLFENFLEKNKFETRPFISGNLLKHPYLKKFSSKNFFNNSNLIHSNGLYIGNNQFINNVKLKKLKKLISYFFKKYE